MKPHAVTQRTDLGVTYAYDADGNLSSETWSGGARHFRFDALKRLTCVGSVPGSCNHLEVDYDSRGSRLHETRPLMSGTLYPRRYAGEYFALDGERADFHILAFGQSFAYKRKSPVTLRTAGMWGLPGLELPPPPPLAVAFFAGVGLVALGFLAVRRDWTPSRFAEPVRAAFSLSMAIVLVVPPLPAQAGGGGTSVLYRRWILGDPLGSATVVLEANPVEPGTQEGRAEREVVYRPFGAIHQAAGSQGMDTETFAGHPREPATALQYMRARWQNPTTGAFLSVDPMVPSISDPQSYNSYSYARNNPINLRDPTGMCPAALVGGTCPPPTWSDVVSIWLSKVIVSDYNFSEGSWAYFGMSNDSKYARVAGKYAGTAITFNQRTGRLASRGVGGDTGSTPGLSSSKKNGEVGAEVVAVREGEVIGSRWHVESDHSYGFGWFTRVADSKGVDYYGHLDPDSTLPAGTKVKAGSAIGRIAVPTNGFSSGPHVHLARKELANPGVWVNPGKTPAIVGGHISLGFGRPHPLFMPNIVPHYGVDWVP